MLDLLGQSIGQLFRIDGLIQVSNNLKLIPNYTINKNDDHSISWVTDFYNYAYGVELRYIW